MILRKHEPGPQRGLRDGTRSVTAGTPQSIQQQHYRGNTAIHSLQYVCYLDERFFGILEWAPYFQRTGKPIGVCRDHGDRRRTRTLPHDDK